MICLLHPRKTREGGGGGGGEFLAAVSPHQYTLHFAHKHVDQGGERAIERGERKRRGREAGKAHKILSHSVGEFSCGRQEGRRNCPDLPRLARSKSHNRTIRSWLALLFPGCLPAPFLLVLSPFSSPSFLDLSPLPPSLLPLNRPWPPIERTAECQDQLITRSRCGAIGVSRTELGSSNRN